MNDTASSGALVSIIIPCFNQAHYLKESVASALAQTYGNIEIIVVNDGSDDPESVAILEGFSAPKTRVIHQANKGRAGVRNTGILAANGEYILPLDADDMIEPGYIARALDLMQKDPKIGIVTCGVRFFGSSEKEWQLPDCTMENMLVENCIHISSLFRKEDWRAAGGFDEQLRSIYEDYDFWLSILESGKQAVRIPEPMLRYRRHAESQTEKLRRHRFSKGLEEKQQALAYIFAKHGALYTHYAPLAAGRIYNALQLPRPRPRHMAFKKRTYRLEHALLLLLRHVPGLQSHCAKRLARIQEKLAYIARVEAQETR
ncbi:glycosyltransferase family 2 protein [Desulfovibrio sp. OttesenSCG-928-I05]|nr:glycosyltransferase family 2 protein [Desulfovibrio sp. OttesenSCG-928-I05]